MRHKILNTSVDCLTKHETLNGITSRIDRNIPSYQVSINASKVNLLNENANLKNIIDKADFINADGMSIIWAAKFLKIPLYERVSGVDLFFELLNISQKKGYRVFFLGATDKSINKMIDRIENDYPRLSIAGYHHGFYKDEETILTQIENNNVDILFLGFSSPMKELWISNHKDRLSIPFIMGVGGGFDIYSGEKKRAPKWIQSIGMEWFYRFIQEPIRLFDRYIIGNFQFINKVIKEKFK